MTRLQTAQDARAFALGGNATFTVVSEKTGARFTFRVRADRDAAKAIHWVALLSGSNNEADYTSMGRISASGPYVRNRNSVIGADAPSARAFDWVWAQLSAGKLAAPLAIFHEGRCGACNRKLTVPESIESGFGPECSGRRERAFLAVAA